MIFFVFNNYFPDNSGFGRRCSKELALLSKIDDVTIVCRHRNNELVEENYPTSHHSIKVVRYKASSKVVHRPENYTGNGLYEIKRNLDVMFGLLLTLGKLFYSVKKPAELYCVTSPLTIPLFGLILAKLFGVNPTLISFHDLEPELAMHLKKITKKHWIIRLELYLERIVCKGFNKILVTTEGQAKRILLRNSIIPDKICVIENSTDIVSLRAGRNKLAHNYFSKEDFVLVYMSAISFDYTIEGLIKFLHILSKNKVIFPHFKFLIIGDGEGLKIVRSQIKNLQLESLVQCIGRINNPAILLKSADAAIIPWEKDIMTETMLPTKLFEYLSFNLAVIAPNFGEFTKTLIDGENAILVNNFDETIVSIRKLIKNPTLKIKLGQAGNKLYLNKYQPQVLNRKFTNFFLKK